MIRTVIIDRNRFRHRWSVFLLVTASSLASTVPPVYAQTAGDSLHDAASFKPARQRVHVVPNEKYGASWIHRFFFGGGYRELWGTSVGAEVLDLSAYAGGVTPIRGGGMGQSKTLHLQGADGRRYVFRPVDKTILLPEKYTGSIVESIAQDIKVSSFHPAAALVVAPLAEALDILHVTPTMYVMPDDPQLGIFREQYAGVLGQIEERPDEKSETNPGFAGAIRIAGTERLLEHLENSSHHRVDAVALLKVRLFDIFLGDRNRHLDQWRWARYDEGPVHIWRPIPRDRDEAFVRNDGLAWSAARRFKHHFTSFGYKVKSVRGVTETGWDLDRLVLAELAKPAWDSLATRIQTQLTDSVIEDAVRHLPPAFYEIGGDELIRDLRHRRSQLPEIANQYYALLSKEVEIVATDDAEYATITHQSDGSVRVALNRINKDGTRESRPYFARRFNPGETRDVRLYLKGGDDHVEVVGARQHEITVRVIGGGGDDALIDTTGTSGSATRFYDYRGDNTVALSGEATFDSRKYKRPRYNNMHKYALDWGSDLLSMPGFGFNTDHGLVLGGVVARYRFGFRKYPYANRMTLRIGVSSSRRFLVEYTADFPEAIGKLWLSLRARASGVDPFRFHGFGNETTRSRSTNFYRVKQQKYTLEPSLSLPLTPDLMVSIGPVFKLTNNREDAGRFLGDVAPDAYGSGWFTQLGSQVALTFDMRNHHTAPTRGVYLAAGGSFYPALGDVEKTFGEVRGEAATYLSLSGRLQPVLTLRVGGKKVWGRFPFHEAAFLGGDKTVRGLSRQRFAGYASVFGNAELRVRVSRFSFLFPTDWGLIGLTDGGRVFLDGESSDKWHVSGGGGIWLAPIDHDYTFSFTVARSDEQTKVNFNVGFMF